MFIFNFYRMYVSIALGFVVYFFVLRSILLLFAIIIGIRVLWFTIEHFINKMTIDNNFKKHCYEFKQQLGPYGIRLANKAEADSTIKKSLAEVFTANQVALKKTVEQLQMMDTLFKAGMQPDADSYQLHDCKLKYGLYRLEKAGKKI